MRKNVNTEHIEGRVFSHELAIKESGPASKNPGTTYIAGNLNVAVDEEGLNVITTHFTYVTAKTKAGGENKTFTALKKIIEEGKNWVEHGKDAATKVKIDTSLALNDFYAQDDQLVSAKVNEGGFVTIVSSLCDENERNTFTVDMVINNIHRVEADEDKNIPEDYVVVHGAIFNFKNDLMPVDLFVRNPAGMSYFENLDVTGAEPIYTKVWGRINSQTEISEKTEESAFGEAAVRTFERKIKEWVITGTAKVPYDFGDEKVMTMEELTKANQDRQVMLAEKKKQRDEYQAQKAAGTAPATAATPTPQAAQGKFTF